MQYNSFLNFVEQCLLLVEQDMEVVVNLMELSNLDMIDDMFWKDDLQASDHNIEQLRQALNVNLIKHLHKVSFIILMM